MLSAADHAPSEYVSFMKDVVRGYLAAGRTGPAIEECERLLLLNARDAESHCLLARAFEMADLQADAAASRKRALEIWAEADPGFCPMENVSARGTL